MLNGSFLRVLTVVRSRHPTFKKVIPSLTEVSPERAAPPIMEDRGIHYQRDTFQLSPDTELSVMTIEQAFIEASQVVVKRPLESKGCAPRMRQEWRVPKVL
jgi:hypothetical protein